MILKILTIFGDVQRRISDVDVTNVVRHRKDVAVQNPLPNEKMSIRPDKRRNRGKRRQRKERGETEEPTRREEKGGRSNE